MTRHLRILFAAFALLTGGVAGRVEAQSPPNGVLQFNLSNVGASQTLPVTGFSYCVVTFTSTGGGGTVKIEGSSDNNSSFHTLTQFTGSGSLSPPVVGTQYSGTVVSSTASALSGIRVNATVISGPMAGTIVCSGSQGAIAPGSITIGSILFPYDTTSNQTAQATSFVGMAGWDGSFVQPLSLLSNGHLNVHVDNTTLQSQILGADGVHQLTVNSDGSMNVKVTSPSPAPVTAQGALESSVCDLTTVANCQHVLSTGEAVDIGTLGSTQFVLQNFSATSATKEITGTSTKNLYALSAIFSNTTATGGQFTISQGTGTNCGTNNVVLMVLQLTAIASGEPTVVFGNGNGVIFHTTVAQSDLCMAISSASATVFVTLNYQLAP